jgi:hypothetical protein
MAFSKREDLRNRITAAVARADRDMLTRVWNEMDYRIDVCRITKGEYICEIYKTSPAAESSDFRRAKMLIKTNGRVDFEEKFLSMNWGRALKSLEISNVKPNNRIA